jgi:hypothetical protein
MTQEMGCKTKERYGLADSGEREEFNGGAVRDVRTGKGRFDLVTPIGLARLAGVYERGAKKYSPRNWEKGMPISRCLDSAERHINDYKMIKAYAREGMDLPPQVNPHEDHLAQAAWNLFAAMHFEDLRPELAEQADGAADPPNLIVKAGRLMK